MTISDLFNKADVFDIKQLAYIKGGNDVIITQNNFIGDGDTDVL